MDNTAAWFKDAGFGLMVHWGLYSLPAGEWKGRRMPFIGEWAPSYFMGDNEIANQSVGDKKVGSESRRS